MNIQPIPEIINITYPAIIEDWYAKGNATPDIYFEVPAIFSVDGACDEPATLSKVRAFLLSLTVRP